MNTILRFIILVSVFSSFFISCDDKNPEGAVNTDESKMVSFAQDTFFLNEKVFDTTISIVVPKYVNGRVDITLGLKDGSAIRDSNFYIDVLEAIIPIGGTGVEFPIEVFNDTLMNPDRSFELEILTVSGSAYAGATNQKCVVMIVNDDHPSVATALFTKSEIVVFENGKSVKIPFDIKKDEGFEPLKGDATLLFDYDRSEGSANVEHFSFRDEGKVSLKKGDSTGFVVVDLFDNSKKNEDRWASIFIMEAEGVFASAESCRLTIRDDDIERIMSFEKQTDTVLENSEIVTISVAITGQPKFDTPKITGEIVFVNGNRGLKVVGDPNFKVRGDTTLNFDISIEDNTEFGVWGDTLFFRNVSNVIEMADYDSMSIIIADNERQLKFQDIEVSDGETDHVGGGNLFIPIILDGGKALNDVNVKLAVGEGTTFEGQYRIMNSDLVIPKGSDRVNAEVRFYHNPSPQDTYFNLELSTDHANTTLAEGGAICKVNILNTDANVQLLNIEDVMKFNNKDEFLELSGFNLSKNVKVTIEANIAGKITYTGQSVVALQKGNTSAKVKFNSTFSQGEKVGIISLKIVRVQDANTDEDMENVINTVRSERKFYVINADDTEEVAYLKTTDWEVGFFTSEEATGENEGNNGKCIHLIDDNTETFWHSKWSGGSDAGPYVIVYDMKKNILPSKVDLQVRHATSFFGAQVYVGDSPEVDDPSWTLINDLPVVTANDAISTSASNAMIGRYLKIIFLTPGGQTIVNSKELKVYGY